MRLVTFEANGHPRAALLRDGCVYDIWGDASRGARATDRTMEAILEGGLLGEIEPLEGDDGVPVEGLQLLPPVTRPGKVICIGLNYREHAEEQGKEPPETPTFFAKFRNALAAPGADRAAARMERPRGLRGGGRVRDRGPLQGRAGERRAWTTWPGTRC